MRPLQRLALALAACGLACAGDSDPIADFLAAQDDSTREACECDWDDELALSPYASEAECVTMRAHDPGAHACIADLLADEPTEHRTSLGCRARANDEYVACVDPAMCDLTARVDCGAAFRDAQDACTELPQEIQRGVNLCMAGQPPK